MKNFARGAVAGAAGTTALNAVGYADMALRGRPASSVPARVAEQLARRVGGAIPGSGAARQNRLETGTSGDSMPAAWRQSSLSWPSWRARMSALDTGQYPALKPGTGSGWHACPGRRGAQLASPVR